MTASPWNPAAGAADPLESLIQGSIRGDADAIDGWFRCEHPLVFRLCYGFLANHTEAEDVAQDAMLHLLDALPARDTQRPYGPWRTRVVLNLCRDRLRRRATRRRAEDAAEALPERLLDPQQAAEATELRASLRATLGEVLLALSEREREIFVLRELEGASTDEVAATLGIQVSTVRSIGTLARRRLRGLLAQRLPDYVPESASREEGGRA